MEPVNKKKSRNEELIKDYLECKKEGRGVIWLVAKYKITSSRIYDILSRYGVKK